ncbi:lipid II flippase MurJ [Actinobacillus delphinicola]|uniref:Virulence factor-like MviN n=1 Tax=Actinobacillus delphinicola TaxID=51161 RepID=A0A448TV77_9PAST|nr:lipid II flippase MurJ [Actinobacillus delphinicola]VEJ09834.1 virulence factor-like MviN [Actinobacillus delphinicola]
MLKKIIQNSLILSIGLLLGRFSGFFREIIIARKLGIGEVSDQIILMLAIPDLLNGLLITGAVSAILIPTLARFPEETLNIINEFTKKLLIITILSYIIISVILFKFYNGILFFSLILSLLSVFPNIFSFISSSYLQYEKRFTKQSLGTLVFNSIIIISLLLGAIKIYLAVGIIIASTGRMLWIMSDLKHATYKKIFNLKFYNNKIFISYSILIFMIIANGLVFIQPSIDKIFSSFMTKGSLSIFSYAEKIYLLPVSVFLTTYAIVLFSDAARLIAEKYFIQAHQLLIKSILLNIIISLLVAIVMYYYSHEIVSIIFFSANFSKENIDEISHILIGFLPVVVFAGTNSMLLKMLFSYEKYNIIMYFSIFIIILKVILDLLLVIFNISIYYMAISTSFLSIVSVIILGGSYFYTYKNKISEE